VCELIADFLEWWEYEHRREARKEDFPEGLTQDWEDYLDVFAPVYQQVFLCYGCHFQLKERERQRQSREERPHRPFGQVEDLKVGAVARRFGGRWKEATSLFVGRTARSLGSRWGRSVSRGWDDKLFETDPGKAALDAVTKCLGTLPERHRMKPWGCAETLHLEQVVAVQDARAPVNWEVVAVKVGTHDARECREHFYNVLDRDTSQWTTSQLVLLAGAVVSGAHPAWSGLESTMKKSRKRLIKQWLRFGGTVLPNQEENFPGS
jgi:hypothetical protein